MIAGVTTKSPYFSLLGSGDSPESAGADCTDYLDGLVSRSIILICVYVYFEGEHAHVIDKQYHIIGIINIEIQYYSIVSLLKSNTVEENQKYTTVLAIIGTTPWSCYK